MSGITSLNTSSTNPFRCVNNNNSFSQDVIALFKERFPKVTLLDDSLFSKEQQAYLFFLARAKERETIKEITSTYRAELAKIEEWVAANKGKKQESFNVVSASRNFLAIVFQDKTLAQPSSMNLARLLKEKAIYEVALKDLPKSKEEINSSLQAKYNNQKKFEAEIAFRESPLIKKLDSAFGKGTFPDPEEEIFSDHEKLALEIADLIYRRGIEEVKSKYPDESFERGIDMLYESQKEKLIARIQGNFTSLKLYYKTQQNMHLKILNLLHGEKAKALTSMIIVLNESLKEQKSFYINLLTQRGEELESFHQKLKKYARELDEKAKLLTEGLKEVNEAKSQFEKMTKSLTDLENSADRVNRFKRDRAKRTKKT